MDTTPASGALTAPVPGRHEAVPADSPVGLPGGGRAALRPGARLAALVREHAPGLYRYAWWLCRDPGGAERLVVETLRQARGLLDGGAPPEAVRWRLFGALRCEHRRQGAPATARPGAAPSGPVGALRERLVALPADCLEPLILQCLDLEVAEIAQVLEIPAEVVRAALAAARRRLGAEVHD